MNGIRLRLTGLNFGQLFNRLKREDVSTQSVKRIDSRTLEVALEMSDYLKVKDYLHKFYKVEKIGYTGKRQFRNLLTQNIGYLIGIFIFAVFAIFSSSFVWQIEICGLETTPKNEIISALKTHNIAVGKTFNADITSIENQLLIELPTIADISIEKRGTTIVVSVSEKLVFSPTEFDPIISEYTGVIKSINISIGTSTVSAGDFVQKGDILVQPFIRSNDGNNISVRPVARIEFESQAVGVACVAKREAKLTYTGKTVKRSYYRIGKLKLSSIKQDKPFEFCEKVVYNKCVSKNCFLPIYLVTVEYREFNVEYIDHTFDQVKQRLIDESLANAQRNVVGEAGECNTQIMEVAGLYFATSTIMFTAIQT